MQVAVRKIARSLVAIMAVAIGSIVRTAAAEPVPAYTEAERAWIAAHPTVRAVFHDASLPPVLQWTPDGQPSGMVGDYLQLLARRSGLRFEVARVGLLTERAVALRNDVADIIPMLLLGDTTEPTLRLTPPFLSTQTVWLTRRDTTDFSPTGTLGGLTTAVTLGSPHEAWLRQRHPQASVLAVNSPLEQVQALADGRADAALAILPLATYVIETHRVSQLTVRAYASDAPSRYAIGVRHDRPLLQAVFEKAMATISHDEHDAIVAKWMPARHFLRIDAALALTDEERDWIQRHGRIRVAYDREFAPYSMERGGEMQGLGADLLREASRRLGLELIEQRAGSWPEVYDAALRSEVDLLVAAGRNEERRAAFRFVGPWSTSATALVTSSKEPGPLTLADLGGTTLAVQDDHFLLPRLQRRYPAMRLQRHATLAAALEAVRRGQAHAAVGNLQTASVLIQRDHPGALTIAGTVADGDSELYFAVRDTHPELATVLEKALESMSDGEKGELRARWLSAVYQPGWSLWDIARWIWPWLLFGTVVVALLLRHQRQLSAEIAQRREAQDALALSVQRLQQASASKSRFIASLGHEIRQPLSSMIAAASLLQQRVRDDGMGRLVRSIADAGEGLLALLGRSLDFSKAEAGMLSLRPEWTPIEAWLHRTGGAFRAAAERKGLELVVLADVPPGTELHLDPTRLSQVVSNLLSNAIKFSERGRVRLGLQVDASAGQLVLSVEDQGPGVSEADAQRMFLPYTQLPSAAAGQGHGLGLALCQQLIEQMGGRIAVRSALGQGTRFDVHLPVQARVAGGAPATQPPAPPQPGGWPAAALLLIDDDPVLRLVHAELLRAGGWTVDDSGEPLAALEHWLRQPVGLVLVDVQMPGLDGPGFAARLRDRAAAAGSQPCIIALTGEDDPEVHARCRASGMDGVLVKPLRPAALQGALGPLAPRYHLVLPELSREPAGDH